MESITLGQVRDVVLFIAALAGGIATLYKLLMAGIKTQLEPISEELKAEKMGRLKSDLTTLMFLAESGAISNEQKILAHEEYDVYVENKGNSYIHDKFESLQKKGKI